ncbi:hypothetical protein FACS189472_05940 [Alphaproteobacteria bacterium]|nr:hypothetical protein FACS189472_05940 [Alphaproteobacteria bacterium]
MNQLLQNFDAKIGINEGIGKYSYLSVESTSSKPYSQSTEITIPLTDSNVDVVEFHRSFFTLNLDIFVNVWTPDNFNDLFYDGEGALTSGRDGPEGATNTDLTKLVRKADLFFIGFKNATDCIDTYKIQHNKVDIGPTQQNKATIESFLYNQMKPQIEKSNKHGSYSLWQDVVKTDESVCGVYISYEEMATQLTGGATRLRVKFPVTIGFDMLLPLQGFNLFPNALFGDLSLVIKINPNALVWSSTDPSLYLTDRIRLLPQCYNVTGNQLDSATHQCEPFDPLYYYDRRFTQVRVPGHARSASYIWDWESVTGWRSTMYVSTPLRIDPELLITRSAVSTIMGFSLKDSVKSAFATYYRDRPFVIPSEKTFIQPFSTGPSASGLNCAMNIPLVIAKEIIALFPRDPNDLTCFRNPEYQSLMLTLLNRNFPQKGCNSNSTEFFRMELESCNLDTILCPTQSFENSYLKKVCPYFPYRQRCSEDDTDFLMIFNLERQSSNAFFADPVNSANESITLTGSPQAQGLGDIDQNSGGDTYYYLNAENEKTDDPAHHNCTCPILAIVSDSFWLFGVGKGPEYETSMSWNECLAKFYPEVFATLAGITPRSAQ